MALYVALSRSEACELSKSGILTASCGEADARYALGGCPGAVLATEDRSLQPEQHLHAEELERARRSLVERDAARRLGPQSEDERTDD